MGNAGSIFIDLCLFSSFYPLRNIMNTVGRTKIDDDEFVCKGLLAATQVLVKVIE